MKNNEKLLDLIGEADERLVPEINAKNRKKSLLKQDNEAADDMEVVIMSYEKKKKHAFNRTAIGGGLCAAAVLGFAIFGGWAIREGQGEITNITEDDPRQSGENDVSGDTGDVTTPTTPAASQTEKEDEPYAVYAGLLDSDVVYKQYGGEDTDTLLTLGYCCVIPYGAPFEEREEHYQRLYPSTSRVTKNTWNDLEIISASSSFNLNMVSIQSLRLGGDITLSGEAHYTTSFDGTEITGINIRLDEESLKKLPSLNPKFFADETDVLFSEYEYVDENIYFSLSEDGQYYTEYYAEIAAILDEKDTVNVTIQTDDFSLEYTEFGLTTDGCTHGRFHNIIDIEID